MKKLILLLFSVLSTFSGLMMAQSTSVNLIGAQYVETFDGIATGLPVGWAVRTGTSPTASGTDGTFTNTASLWNVTSGRFYNFASADIGETGGQNAATDRSLGLRQTSSVGDPGGAFVVKLANTANLNTFSLSFKLQSLDKTSVRAVTWGVDYAIGDSTNYFTATTTPAALSTGGSTFSNQTVTVNFGSALDNKNSAVWIRIRAIAASTGSGNRPSTGIDDFTLNYLGGSGNNTPSVSASLASLSFVGTEGVPSEVKSYTVSGSNLTNDLTLTAPTPFEISKTNNTGFGSTLTFSPTAGSITSQTVFVRLNSATKGDFNGNISHSSPGATTQNVAVSGKVSPPVSIVSVATAKGLADSTLTAITGRLTVTTQFGGRLVYVQDNTAGIAVFANNATAFPNNWQMGDSVQIVGMVVTFNGYKEILDPSQAFVITGQTNKPVTPLVITPDQQLANEGKLVTLKEATFVASGNFTNNSNFDYADCQNIYSVLRINGGAANDLVGKEIPKNTREITGIMGRFNAIPQLLPRSLTDITTVAANQCSVRGVCSPTAVLSPDGTLDRNKTFDVAVWNVEWLGHPANGPSNEQLQQDNVKCVVEKLKSDVVVLVEVCDTSKLKDILPTGYRYKCSAQYYSHFFDDPETTTNPAQKVCVAYNTVTVNPIEADCKALLTNNATFTVNSPDNSFWASGRLPYLFSANVTLDGITHTVRVVGIHAKAGSAAADYTRRETDVQALKKELDEKYANDLVILAGDFNDDLDTSITVGKSSTYANFVRDTARYRAITKSLSDAKKRSTVTQTEMVDHIVVSNELTQAYENNTADVATATSINFISAYRSATTDHYPVWARFDLKKTTTTSLRTLNAIEKLEAVVAPNPTEGGVLIVSVRTDNNEDALISIYNAIGQTVLTQKQRLTTGWNIWNMDIASLKAGMYYVSVKQAGKMAVLKVVRK